MEFCGLSYYNFTFYRLNDISPHFLERYNQPTIFKSYEGHMR